MKTRKWLRAAVVLSGLWAASASAMTLMPVDYVCPIGGEKFTAQTMGSGTSFGRYLDGQMYGPTQSPWPLVRCPGNGFVLYKRDFSADEIKRLTPYVQGEEYQALQKQEASYWLLAQLLRHMGESNAVLANVLHQATWQANADQYPRYVAAAAALKRVQCQDKADVANRDEAWLYCQMILGEWERRLSNFSAAQQRFTHLQPLVDQLVSGEDKARAKRQYTVEIAQQLQLIAAVDASKQMAVDGNADPSQQDMPSANVDSEDAVADAAMAAAQAAAQAAADAAAAAAEAAGSSKDPF